MSGALFINPTAMEAGLMAAARARALSPARAAAFETFAATGMPHRRMEAWKWTDLRAALREDPAKSLGDNEVIARSLFAGVPAFEATLMNGAGEWPNPAPEGVAIRFADADPPLDPGVADHPLANLCAAMAGRCLEISIVEGTEVGPAIHLRRIAGAGAHHARARLKLGRGARATLIESFDGAGGYFSNSLLEIELEEGAALTRFILQDGSALGAETSVAALRIAARAQFRQTALLLGAKAVRIETRIACVGEGACVELSSASILDGERHADVTSLVRLDAPGSTVTQSHKSALRDRARGVFQGKFFVARAGQKTDARMRAQALLLCDLAQADHKPELEIYADDVQCAHGATAGALDDEALFYLAQRGLSPDAARALLVAAFIEEIFDAISDEKIAEAFRRRAARWLEAS